MKIIYGLGNPGRRYANTRHNIGFLVADFLSSKWRIPLTYGTGELVCGKGTARRTPVLIAKPQTYMNLSGMPLRKLSFELEDLIVIHDDMDIPAGKVRVKLGGGTGGHKGLDSITSAIEADGYVRIRCGIGRPEDGSDPSDYVLGAFTGEELPVVRKQIEDAASAVEMCLREGVAKAMNTFNKRDRENKDSDA